MEDLDCAHIYMNSISYQTEEENRLEEQREGAAGSGSGKLTQPSGFHTGGSVDCVSKKAVPWHRQTHHSSDARPWKHSNNNNIYIFTV